MSNILFVKHGVETKIEAPPEWSGQELRPDLVKKELELQGLAKPEHHLTIHVWRNSQESGDLVVRDNDQIFACYNLRNYYRPCGGMVDTKDLKSFAS